MKNLILRAIAIVVLTLGIAYVIDSHIAAKNQADPQGSAFYFL